MSGTSIDGCPPRVPRDRYLQYYQGACYQFITYRTRYFAEAEADCRHNGGHLASVSSPEVNAFLTSQLKINLHSHTEFWIGLTDARVEGRFEWTDGSAVTYSNWGPGETTHIHRDDEDCVTLDVDENGLWKDHGCDHSQFYGRARPFICQYKPVTTATTLASSPPATTAAATTAAVTTAEGVPTGTVVFTNTPTTSAPSPSSSVTTTTATTTATTITTTTTATTTHTATTSSTSSSDMTNATSTTGQAIG